MANASFCPVCGDMLAPDDYYDENGMLPPEHEHMCPLAPPASKDEFWIRELGNGDARIERRDTRGEFHPTDTIPRAQRAIVGDSLRLHEPPAITIERFERFVKPLINYFYEMKADYFDDSRDIALQMLERIGIDYDPILTSWRVEQWTGMYRHGRLNDRPDEDDIQERLAAIYGPKEFHFAQPTESIIHWSGKQPE